MSSCRLHSSFSVAKAAWRVWLVHFCFIHSGFIGFVGNWSFIVRFCVFAFLQIKTHYGFVMSLLPFLRLFSCPFFSTTNQFVINSERWFFVTLWPRDFSIAQNICRPRVFVNTSVFIAAGPQIQFLSPFFSLPTYFINENVVHFVSTNGISDKNIANCRLQVFCRPQK